MSEFEGKSGKWAWEIQKEQQANLVELRSSIENLVQKYKHDAHASSLFGDQDKARVYNCFANQLKNLLKGGACCHQSPLLNTASYFRYRKIKSGVQQSKLPDNQVWVKWFWQRI